MGQCSVFEPVGNPLAVDGLLADASNHLRYVDEGAFGATQGHDQGRIGLVQGRLGGFARRLTNGGQLFEDKGFQRLILTVASLIDKRK